MEKPDISWSFHDTVVYIIKKIPRGKVMTYGKIAAVAGNNRGSRQVARILHSSSRKHKLPWHRVINSAGKISLPDPEAKQHQRDLLEADGIQLNPSGTISLKKYLWEVEEVEEI